MGDQEKDEQKKEEEQQQERRRAPRIKKQLMVQYKSQGDIYKWNIGAVRDFSELGMLITTEEFFPNDTVLNFRFKLPSNPFEYLDINGRVVACDKIGTTGHSTKIELLDMKPEHKDSFRTYINWFLSQGGQGK
jgi:hypothetical protein